MTPGVVDLAVANPRAGMIRVALTVEGKGVVYVMHRNVAASLASELAKALADLALPVFGALGNQDNQRG